MDCDLILLNVWKQWKKWKLIKHTFQQRNVKKRQILKLFVIWKLIHEAEGAHKMWVRPIFKERQRMSVKMFNQLLHIVGPVIEKQSLVRDPIPARTRLLVCLRYLASGDSMTSISYFFRIGINTVSRIISETCEQLWNTLHKSVFPEIKETNWLKIANDFAVKWNFPHCIGAIDGKHVIIQSPPHSGSTYYNYKGNHSINLLAVCDANYCFTLIDIGAEGRQSDGGIFAHSNFGQRFEANLMNLPQPRLLESSESALPFVLVADEAFALTTYMIRPYPRSGRLNGQRKVFNYRLSQARRMIESAFGILTAKWRIYRRPIISSVSTAVKIVQATVCLHNFVIQNENQLPLSERCYTRIISGEETVINGALQDVNNAGRTNAHTRLASRIRDEFASYFENLGAVSWQWEKVLLNDF
ncbi:protein ANTAGONIST OF LIKE HETEROCHROMATIN PROTEIN 1-like isoform X2 [Ooceraea biroi]|uniref:protein ANTAGONIST OF LIKE HETEROCHROMATIN PROTEIN 1-like isoform X2 n=1 Tax=Ooceraea biroi TaxID=2015173 RepID=UPI0005BC2B9F|nr:protein ANTAGONIST OF LIKE HETEROCHROMATIN PROTEIN 1-like isoform X2 [Ooceraea biroi]